MKSFDLMKILAFDWMTFLLFTRVQGILGPELPFFRRGCFVGTCAEIPITRPNIFLVARAGAFIY